MFLSPWFAIAGLAAALGPVIIHLLNRQRYRVVEWAAMDLLRQAARRNRRIMRIRDLILLILRTAVVVVFGLAMARPYLSTTAKAVDADQPVHAVLLVDNSLSMGYQRLEGTLLDTAKQRAREFIDRLPPGCRISVLPMCGPAGEFSLTGYGTEQDALEALDSIEVVDRSAPAMAAIDLAQEACRRVPTLVAKQIVFISDQQASNWPAQINPSQTERLTAPVQLVQVSPDKWENAWVAGLELQDSIADLSTPSVFLATIAYQGPAPRHDVQVTLALDGRPVAAETIDLQPGQVREVRFSDCEFDTTVEPGRASFVTAAVSIPHDRLPEDDERVLSVPVVAGLPVVFVDQLGDREDRQRNRLGETYRLRRLLAPVTGTDNETRQLVRTRHLQIDQLDRHVLEDARLVVIAGVDEPGNSVSLLREYLEQGGLLVIGAGGDFNPAAWSESAWREGLGILPAPLKPIAVGGIPGAATGAVKPFQLDTQSMIHDYFQLEQTSASELEDLYRQPYFFKAVEADLSESVIETLVSQVSRQAAERREALDDCYARLEALAEFEVRRPLSEEERRERTTLETERDEARPHWLSTGMADGRSDELLSPEETARRSRPRVLARFSNQVPFMIERQIGAGRVLFVSTGVYRDWNTLTATHAVLIFDRIFRRLLEATLPVRNLDTVGRIVLPAAADERQHQFRLVRPNGKESPLSVDALGPESYGVAVENLSQRGVYQVEARPSEDTPGESWQVQLAVNGPAYESDLTSLDELDLAERLAGFRWTATGQTITLAAAPLEGRDVWKWLIIAVLAGLLGELLFVAWPSLRGRGAR